MFFFKKKNKKAASKKEADSRTSSDIKTDVDWKDNDLLKLSLPDDLSSSLDLPHLQADPPTRDICPDETDAENGAIVAVKPKAQWLPTTRLISGQILNTSVDTTTITATSLGNLNKIVTTSSYDIQREAGSSVSSGSSGTTVAPPTKPLADETGTCDNASLDDGSHALVSERIAEKDMSLRSGAVDPKEAHRSVRDSLLSLGHRASRLAQKETEEVGHNPMQGEEREVKQTTAEETSVPEPTLVMPQGNSTCEGTMQAVLSDGAAQVSTLTTHVDELTLGDSVLIPATAKDEPRPSSPQPAAIYKAQETAQAASAPAGPRSATNKDKDRQSHRRPPPKDTTRKTKPTSLTEKRSTGSLIPRGNRPVRGEKKTATATTKTTTTTTTMTVSKRRPGSEASDSADTVTDDDNDVPITPTSPTVPTATLKSKMRRQSPETGIRAPKVTIKKRATTGKETADTVSSRARAKPPVESTTAPKQPPKPQSKIPVRGESEPVSKKRDSSSLPARKMVSSRLTTR